MMWQIVAFKYIFNQQYSITIWQPVQGIYPRCPGVEREIKSIGLFEDRGHQGTYSPYKPFNHNLYIGIVIFPHIDNPQSTGYNQPMKKTIKMINEKSEGLLQNKDFNEGSKFCRYETFFSAHDLGVAKTLMN